MLGAMRLIKRNRAAMLLALLGVWASAAAAGPADPRIGSHWRVQTRFDLPPERARPVPGSACEAADRYVSLVGARKGSEVAALFARDALFLGPDEQVLRGRDAINAFYSVAVASRVSHVIPLSFMDRGQECMMEIAIATIEEPDHYRLLAMDHFTVDKDGLIDQLLIYFRPSAIRR
jgi:hypothetical protein